MPRFDVVIVGAGLAGMRAAVEITRRAPDLSVAILTKVYPTRSHSGAAQGGIAAALENLGEGDSPALHMFDTVKGSDWLGDQDAIEVLTHEAPALVRELEHMGVIFSRTEAGLIAQRNFGGHSKKRACYAADWTGHALLHGMHEQIVSKRITIFAEWQMVSLIQADGVVRGVTAYQIATGDLEVFHARAVLFGTGGYGRAFKYTSNAHANTGDGLVCAYLAGLQLEDMEFVQFHPTGLYQLGILLSEACRGEGGFLVNAEGERFMARYAPDRMELAPRDVVSRSIQREIDAGRGWEGGDAVALDMRHLGREAILDRLPQVRELALDFVGLDMVDDPVPIQPTAHYSMGGIPANIHGEVVVGEGEVVTGFYAAGECACISNHGANRLGTNSLLEAALYGKRAGARIAEFVPGAAFAAVPPDAKDRAAARLQGLLDRDGNERMGALRRENQALMTSRCGVFREAAQLTEAIALQQDLQRRYQHIRLEDRSKTFNTELTTALETENILIFSETILVGALAREESRGAHFRTDFPTRDDARWMKHSLFARGVDGRPVLTTKPVRMPLTPDRHIPPQERTY